MNEILIDSDTVLLNYSKSDFLFELIWKKNPKSAEFREVYTLAMNMADKRKTLLLLADIRNEGIIDIDDIKWLEKNVLAMAIQLGVKKVALVSEDTIYSMLYAGTLKKKLEKSPIQVTIFEDISEAKAWLLAI